ncbi:MAG: TolC family protein, partial [Tannerella sp.]|nr:TolC family protein [Tannerella sp.]
MKRLSVILLMLATIPTGRAQLTWERCQELARDNYPLIKQYKLVDQSVAYTVVNAAKAHLPQVSLTAQATYQSDVATFPEQMNALYQQIGLAMKGINRDQYRATLEVTQSLWDGGQVRAQQEIARAGGEVSRQSLEVEMYT